MAEKWTEDQLKVLEAKDRNVLVSAAAGSGKTTVLIERIMRMISEGEHPIDVDRLLIVTFTDAAAGEMRSRLRASILKKIEADPGNAHLHRQLLLLPRARVSTIHSFCTWLLRNYFHVIDLEPGFRVGDEEETELLRSDVMKEVLESEYRKGNESFLNFTEIVSSKKTDDGVEPLILKLYAFSQSAPYPEEWLRNCLEPYSLSSPEELEGARWFRLFVNLRRSMFAEILKGYGRLIEKCNEEGGPFFCIPDFTEEMESIRFASLAETYEEMQERIGLVSFPTKKRAPKGVYVDPDLNEEVTKLRKDLKDSFADIKAAVGMSEEQIIGEIRATEPEVRELIRLTSLFTEEYQKAKRKKNLVDFNDLEHFAIQVLRNPDHSRTEVAKTLAAQFAEIMIDEYQDSNMVQEELLTAVSGIDDGRNNMFMVGDMKQSIYRFRMARPDLFMGKYESFSSEGGPSQKIELHANFRSRREVVDGANFIFRQIMHKAVGGIEYDDDAALRAEARYEAFEGADYTTELLLIRPNATSAPPDSLPDTADLDPPEEAPEELSKLEAEVHAIAQEILRITDRETGLLLQDKDKDKKIYFRRTEYRDIVLLSRSLSGYETLVPEVLLSYGIPVYAKSRTGYFSTWEVRLMLNLLRVIDNPIQDIPLAAVLRSPLFGFTSEELAEIRLPYRPREEGNGFYGALKLWAAGGAAALAAADGSAAPAAPAASATDPGLCARVLRFLEKMELYREKARSLTVSALLRYLFADLEIEVYVSAMKGGEQRSDNLIALLEKAEAFENTSYHGLYHFIRYIERLGKTDIDEGETNSLSEKDNVVRLMTTHSSKGLEFPVVFVIGLSKRVNTQDEKGIAVFHPDYGIGMNLVDVGTRVKRNTLIRSAFRDCVHSEAFGEELRILYVAMTRAEQKLYLTGVCPESFELSDQEQWEQPEEALSEAAVFKGKSYFDWIVAAYRKDGPIRLRMIGGGDVQAAAPGAMEAPEDASEPFEAAKETSADALQVFSAALPDASESALRPLVAKLDEVLSFPYIYDDLYRVRSTMSVSLLKEMAKKLREDRGEVYDEDSGSAVVDDIPEAKKLKDGRKAAAAYGTLVHLVFEKMIPGEKAETAVARMLAAGLIDEEQAASVNRKRFDAFYESELGKRCISAYARNELYRERRFIIGLPVGEVLPDMKVRDGAEELLMLQGTTDLYFEEEDGLVLADYKTDRVKTARELAERYSIQLDLYEKALVQSTGKKVKEKWIWSTALGEAIRVG